jgi:hypothetical protein
LTGRAHIDDRKAPMRQADRAVDEQTTTVRAAMAEHIPHLPKAIGLDWLTRIEMDDAGKAAHKLWI